MHDMAWAGMGIWTWLFWVVLLALAVWAAVRIGRRADRSGFIPSEPADPIEIVRERYARGEITLEEYQEMKYALERR